MSGALKTLPISLSAWEVRLLSGAHPPTSLEALVPSLLPTVSELLAACSRRRCGTLESAYLLPVHRQADCLVQTAYTVQDKEPVRKQG